MSPFTSGPFSFDPAPNGRVGGQLVRRWTIRYGDQDLGHRTLPDELTAAGVIDAFSDDIGSFICAAKDENAPQRISLIDFETGEAVGGFFSDESCGMTPGIIDDRSRYWIRTQDRLYSRAVSLSEFAEIAVECAAPANSWIAGLLPDEVTTDDPAAWRAPTSLEIRHIVGEGSLTGITGAKAAELVGVTPSNFRKYTAREGAKTRQSMSFAMWHLLLHRLSIQSPSREESV